MSGCARCFFLYAIHRFHLPNKPGMSQRGLVPFEGYLHLLNRRFGEAIDVFLDAQEREPSDAISSALAAAYHRLAFQTLADQVRRSVRSVRGNQWMFRVGHPVRSAAAGARPETAGSADLTAASLPFPILRERTPVRMDLSHSAWSDIFFLGMDYPEGARVLNVSIDLGVRGRDAAPRPPVEAYFRVIDEPVLRLTSVDLATHRRHHRPGRGVRFRARLPGPAEGRRDRRGPRSAGDRGLRPEPGRPAGPDGRRRAVGIELVS